MNKGGKSSAFLLIIAVVLIFVIGFLALLIITQNRNSNNNQVDPETQLKLMYLGDNEIALPSDWAITSYQKSTNSGLEPYSCNFSDNNTNQECSVYLLESNDFQGEELRVSLTYPASYNFAGGSTPYIGVEEEVTFLGEELNIEVNYNIDTTVEDFDIEDESTFFADLRSIHSVSFCNSDQICFTSDFRSVSEEKSKAFQEIVFDLVQELKKN